MIEGLKIAVLGVGFISPALFAAGAAAVSIPIVIHLLNKRKFRVVAWAAMAFLLAAQRRNARRLKFQRWLLLAARCLALLLLAAGVGQLVTQSAVFGGMFGGQRLAVVVWDDSYSMGYEQAGGSAFERSKKLLGEWLSGLPAGERVLLVRASVGGKNAVGAKPTLDHALLEREVREARVTDEGTDLAGALELAGAALKDEEATSRDRDLFVLTDFSESSVRKPAAKGGGTSGETRLKQAMADAGAHATQLRVIDLGTPEQGNVGVTGLQAMRPVVVAGVPAEYEVRVTNGSGHAVLDLPVTVTLDGAVIHTERLGKVEAGAERAVLTEVTAPTVGRHLLEARVPADLLPVDDVRRMMVDVRREVPVLLVDGSPGDGKGTQGSVVYLWAGYGLSVDGKSGSVFAPRRITELELPTTVLGDFAEVVLSDTAVPTPAVREGLRKFVQDGGLLMIFPGNRTNTALMNSAFGEAGANLLPATLGQPVRTENSTDMAKGGGGVAFAPEGYTNPALAPFGEMSRSGKDVGFLSVQTWQYLKLGVPTDGSTQTVLRYAKGDGTAGDAAVVVKNVGKGKVILFASTADTEWNTFGAKPSFVPFLHELTYETLRSGGDALTLGVGEHLDISAEAANPGMWTGPRGVKVAVSTQTGADGKMRLMSGSLTAAGVYAATDGRPAVVVNPPGDEADIRHITSATMAAALGIEEREITTAPEHLQAQASVVASSKDSDLARDLIFAALAMFVAETVMARAFSTYR